MTITVTEFKTHCLKILREMEQSNKAIEISRQGKVRFRIIPVLTPSEPPWKRLQSKGVLRADASESVITDQDFGALR